MLNTLATCGGFTIDDSIPNLVHYAVLAIQIFIPIILIIFGMLDMGKAVMAGDEKVMKENQSKFLKRLLYAVLVFLIVAVVKLIFNVLATTGVDGDSNAVSCVDCFISGPDSKGCK